MQRRQAPHWLIPLDWPHDVIVVVTLCENVFGSIDSEVEGARFEA